MPFSHFSNHFHRKGDHGKSEMKKKKKKSSIGVKEMVESPNQKKQLGRSDCVTRSLVSCAMALLTQIALSLVPRFLFFSPLLVQLSLSVVVLLVVVVIGGWLRRGLGVKGSASAFVFCSILFLWCFYLLILRQAMLSLAMDFMFNGQVAMLIAGLYSMLKSDPGYVKCEDSSLNTPVSAVGVHNEELELFYPDSEVLVSGRRVRYCRVCKAYVKVFDHHCPAFGNCIGQKNYPLFMALLFGFLMIEASYLACSYKYISKFGISSTRSNSENVKTSLYESLAYSTAMFSILQLVWQPVFFAWHVYCICVNIRSDEWINWKKYPEFHLIGQSEPGQCCTEMRFTNPYDKGVVENMKEFLLSRQ